MAIVGPLPGGLPPPPGDRCRFLGRGVFVNPGGGPSHDLHDNDGLLGLGPPLVVYLCSSAATSALRSI